jgi:nucleoside-diphosphate-sugar epimerase
MKVLVLGGTGCMGNYLCPKLVERGFEVDAVTLDPVQSEKAGLTYIVKAATDGLVEELMQKGYDAVVDFMWYDTPSFQKRYETFLKNTKHYIALSSYRVYADSKEPLSEESARLLDTVKDPIFLASDDYAQAKCRIENLLRAYPRKNWTIVRPVVVYGGARLPLVTVGVDRILELTAQGKSVPIPKEAMEKTAAIIWAGDAAEMIARLVLNEQAYGETYLLGSSKQVTWREVYGYYQELTGMTGEEKNTEDFLTAMHGRVLSPTDCSRWILEYDRLYDRKINNLKVLKATGLKQSDLTTVKDALKIELEKREKQ